MIDDSYRGGQKSSDRNFFLFFIYYQVTYGHPYMHSIQIVESGKGSSDTMSDLLKHTKAFEDKTIELYLHGCYNATPIISRK